MTERFELLEQIGKGGMGAVWKARDLETGDIVALKLLHAHLAEDEDYVQRLEREVEIARRIDSPQVVRVLGYGTRDGLPYMVMEYVDGQSLRQLLHERGPISWDGPGQVREIVRQIALGLAAAHAAGVIHRDVKPSNVLVASDGTVKLADFGISRAMDLTRMTGSATTLGTPAYMAPDMDTTPSSDLCALGCVAFEMLTGTPPFEGDTQQQVLMRHLREQPNLGRLPSNARAVVARLLAKEPRDRPANAELLAAMLAEDARTERTRPIWLLVAAPLGLLGLAGAAAFGLVSASRGDGSTPTSAMTTPTIAIDVAPPSATSVGLTETCVDCNSSFGASTRTPTPLPSPPPSPGAPPTAFPSSATPTARPSVPTTVAATPSPPPTATPTHPPPPTPTPTSVSSPATSTATPSAPSAPSVEAIVLHGVLSSTNNDRLALSVTYDATSILLPPTVALHGTICAYDGNGCVDTGFMTRGFGVVAVTMPVQYWAGVPASIGKVTICVVGSSNQTLCDSTTVG